MKAKILILLLALAGMLPLEVRAQVAYTTNGTAISITGTGAIADGEFESDQTITSVTIGTNVTSIGNSAFEYCDGLTNVTIGNAVANIGNYAFESCVRLKRVTIPNSVTNIGNGAFVCYNLTNIAVDAVNPYYSSTNGVLFDKAQITLIQYPAGLTNSSYVIPNSVTNIGNSAFEYCASLNSVVIPNSVTNIGYSVFLDCTSLKSVAIPNSVISIGVEAFQGCTSLTNVMIGNSVTGIENGAFIGCTSLMNVIVPSSVTFIGGLVFSSSLTNIAVDAANPVYSSVNGVLFNKAQTAVIEFPPGLGGSYTIPNSVTGIGVGAFYGCSKLSSVIIPNGVISIGYEVCIGCTSLTNVAIGNGVTSIGVLAFCDCGLMSVTIPNSVTNIGDEAFESCTSLTNITFMGNAPELADANEFADDSVAANAVYYYCGMSGWGTTYGGLPTVELAWTPQIVGGAKVQSSNFSFSVIGTNGMPAIVEASTNLVDWQPVWTNILSGASATFTDSQWTNYPARFYRAR